MRTRSNAGFFERLRGPSSISYREELKRRRAEAKKDRMRQRERQREELLREREQIREANKLKRQLLKEEAQERKLEAKRAQERKAEEKQARLSEGAIQRAYARGAKTLGEAMAMVERGNPTYRYMARPSYSPAGGWDIIDTHSGQVVRTVKTKSAARQVLASMNAKALRNPRGKKGGFARCVKAVSERGGAKDPKAVCGAIEKRRRGQKNPADAAVSVSEEFHGRKVKAMVPVQQKRHYHKYLAELGELRKLVVDSRDGKHRVTLTGFQGAMLTANEQKSQLFITGGDQKVNLKDFGIAKPHEVETLGEVTKIEYFTDKEHLGDEGGVATYVHKFRSTNDNGRHVTVRLARNPDLIYYTRDKHLEFSGGSYEIKAEGIDK